MTTSQETKQINGAMVNFHKEVRKVGKDAKNPFFKSKYASLSNILETIDEPLVNNGLAIVQFPEGEYGLTTRLIHDSGEWMEGHHEMKPVKDTPQDRGSAITYARRYAIAAILSLNVDDDDDGNQASGRGSNGTQKAVETKHITPVMVDDYPKDTDRKHLFALLEQTSFNDNIKEQYKTRIVNCKTWDSFNNLKDGFEANKKHISQIPNPSAKDTNSHLKTVQS